MVSIDRTVLSSTQNIVEGALQHWLPLLGVLVAVHLFYGTCLVIYRLFFSPIAHFPGPRLAAATQWVEIWYDVFLGGQFTLKIEKWHQK